MKLAILAPLAAAAMAGAADAAITTLYTNLGPGGAFNEVSSSPVLGPDEISIGNIDQAVPFTIGPNDASITSVQLALRLNDGPDLLAVHLMSDAGGVPGAILTTTDVSGIPNAPGLVDAVFPGAFDLTANVQYWIAADASSDTEISWHLNTIAETGRAGRSGSPPEPWNFNPDAVTPAFAVMGREIPTPGAAALLACAGLAGLRRHR